MPLFAHLFHLTPTDIDALTMEQWRLFRGWADDYMKRQQNPNQG